MSAIVSLLTTDSLRSHSAQPLPYSPQGGAVRGELTAPTGWALSPPTAAGSSLLKGDTAVVTACSWMGFNTPHPHSLGKGSLKMACLGLPQDPQADRPQVQFSS